jgi:hypothetical protein
MADFTRMGIPEHYIGAAADDKPTGVPPGSRCYEYDTGKEYITDDDGSNWRAYTPTKYVADGVGLIFGNDGDITCKWNDAGTAFEMYDAGDNKIFDYLVHDSTKPRGEFRLFQNFDYDDSQSPVLNIVQAGSGEAVFRMQHGNKPGGTTFDWGLGVLGHATSYAYYHFLDTCGSTYVVRGAEADTIAEQRLSGRILFYHNFDASENPRAATLWEDDPQARVEVRGNHDEVQFMVVGWTTQTNNIMQVKNSGGTVLFRVANTNILFGGPINMQGQQMIGMGTFGRTDSSLTQQAGGTWTVQTKNASAVMTDRLTIANGANVNRIQVAAGACLNIAGGTHATPLEGDTRVNSNKMEVYLNGDWEVITSS